MMTDKESQLKAKLLKLKLAGKLTDYQKRDFADKINDPLAKKVPFGKDDRDPGKIRDDALDKSEASTSGKKVRPKTPTQDDYARIISAKIKVDKLKKKSSIPDEIMQEAADAAGQNKNLAPSYIAQDHHHNIVFKGHRLGGFKGASLNSQSGKFAKYWLLNAKETNGNGWGIAAHTAKENMKKFIGRPLVVTAKSWHGASEYGEEYEHPYLPTNDISAILRHQDKFRVGSIVDVFEDNNGDWFANVEMLPKFASRTLPPFCSPAIYQLDAKENEGQISKWEALHLAALNENPAYGARIALLKGTCIGTGNECKVQFKVAKLDAKVVCTKKLKGRVASLKKKQKIALDLTENVKHHMKGFMGRPEKQKTRLEKELFGDMLATNSKSKMQLLTNLESIRDDKILERDDEGDIINSLGDTRGTALVHSFSKDNPHGIVSPIDKQEQEYQQTKQLMKKPVDGPNTQMTQERATRTLDDIEKGNARKSNRPVSSTYKFKISKLKARVANIYQNEDGRITLRGDEDETLDSTLNLHMTGGADASKFKHKPERYYPKRTRQQLKKRDKNVGDVRLKGMMDLNQDSGMTGTQEFEDTFNMDNLEDVNKSTDVLGVVRKIKMKNNGNKGTSLAKLKARLKLASLGEQNMTYQDSKKVKIIKKKHPEVRKASLASEFAHNDIDGVLRKIHSSPLPPDKREHQSSFLSSTGDYIGGGEDHTDTIKSIFKDKEFTPEDKANDGPVTRFSTEHGLPRVQRRMTQRGGRVSFGIHSKVNRTQLRTMQDVEKGGEELAFVVGKDTNGTVGEGYRDLTKALRENQFL